MSASICCYLVCLCLCLCVHFLFVVNVTRPVHPLRWAMFYANKITEQPNNDRGIMNICSADTKYKIHERNKITRLFQVVYYSLYSIRSLCDLSILCIFIIEHSATALHQSLQARFNIMPRLPISFLFMKITTFCHRLHNGKKKIPRIGEIHA